MRIAFFVHRFPALSETFILHQVTGLLDRGHDVRIFSEEAPGDAPVHSEVEARNLMDRVVPLHERMRGMGEWAWPRVLALRAPQALLQMRRRSRARYGGGWALGQKLAVLAQSGPPPDVVHAHFGDVALRNRHASLIWPVPFVASFYGHDASRVPLREGAGVYGPLESTARCVTVLSGDMRRQLRGLGFPEEVIREQRLGIHPDRFPFHPRSLPSEGEPVRILTVARLVEKKGVEYALEALAPLAERHSFQYRVLGDGPLRGHLEARSRALGLDSRVEFSGNATQDDVRRAMDEAHIFLLPSVTARDGDREGTPTVLLEASAAGLPVVATQHAGIPEVVLDGVTGVLVPEGDARALSRGIEEVLSSPEAWPSLGESGRKQVVRRHDMRTLARSLEDLYRELLDAAPQRKASAVPGSATVAGPRS